MASSNAGPITGSELIVANQDGKRVLLTRPQLATLIALTAAISPRAYASLTEKTGDENFQVLQGSTRVEFNSADLATYLAASGAPDFVLPAMQPAPFSGRERILIRQGQALTAIDLQQVLYVRGLGGSLGGVGSVVVPVAGAVVAVTQLAAANQIFQRTTITGGGQGKGQGTIPLALSAVSATGSISARCSSGSASRGDLQAPWTAATIASTGAQTVNITGVDARLGWFYLDILDSSGNWQNGTTLVGMGRLIAVSGQSLAVRMFGRMDSQTATNASLGVTPNANSSVFATYTDGQRTVATATWAVPADGTNYDATYAAERLRLEVAASGVNCGLIGHSRGAQSITVFIPGGGENAKLRANLDAAGGFEEFDWLQGHSDAGSMAAATYQSNLTTLFSDLTAHNAARGASYTKLVASIPNIASATYGTFAQKLVIRKASSDWATANGATYADMRDLDLIDGIHQSQAGGIPMARHFYRASRPALGLGSGDKGPALSATGTRATGTADVAFSATLPTGASALVSIGSPSTRFGIFNSGDTASRLALDGTTPITIGTPSGGIVPITLKLASPPADTQALDVYFGFSPDPVADGGASMLYDNNASDGDGLTRGRQLIANLSPITVAAPGGGGGGGTTQVGPNLTATSATYAAGPTGFGQVMNGGWLNSASGTDILGAGQLPFTIEGRISISAAPTAVKTAFGQSRRSWIGINASGRLVGNFTSGTNTDNWFNGSTNTVAGTNPVITDGAWHHVALVVNASGGSLYLDGALVGTTAATPATAAPSAKFGIGTLLESATFAWTGLVDEVAVATTERYTSAFTPPSAPFVGNESGIVALYHLDGSGNAATY